MVKTKIILSFFKIINCTLNLAPAEATLTQNNIKMQITSILCLTNFLKLSIYTEIAFVFSTIPYWWKASGICDERLWIRNDFFHDHEVRWWEEHSFAKSTLSILIQSLKHMS